MLLMGQQLLLPMLLLLPTYNAGANRYPLLLLLSNLTASERHKEKGCRQTAGLLPPLHLFLLSASTNHNLLLPQPLLLPSHSPASAAPEKRLQAEHSAPAAIPWIFLALRLVQCPIITYCC
jgi:hypothetical protein